MLVDCHKNKIKSEKFQKYFSGGVKMSKMGYSWIYSLSTQIHQPSCISEECTVV